MKRIYDIKIKKKYEVEWTFSNIYLKVKEIMILSILFSAVILFSNIGLDKVNLNVHVLLRTTSVLSLHYFKGKSISNQNKVRIKF
jgi:hypothetical protein